MLKHHQIHRCHVIQSCFARVGLLLKINFFSSPPESWLALEFSRTVWRWHGTWTEWDSSHYSNPVQVAPSDPNTCTYMNTGGDWTFTQYCQQLKKFVCERDLLLGELFFSFLNYFVSDRLKCIVDNGTVNTEKKQATSNLVIQYNNTKVKMVI